MSKYLYSNEYIIYYPGTEIPINKKFIKNPSILQVYDKALLLKSYYLFNKYLTKKTIFDEKYFRQLHYDTFQKLYKFAGEYRSQDVSKGDTVFCKAKYIQEFLIDLFNKFKADNYLKNYNNKPLDEFAEKIAYYMGELIAIHPFWEFNGRTTRLFFDMIAVSNGYNYIDYTKFKYDGEENSFIQASIECVQLGNNTMLKEIIKQGLCKRG
ncbi:MAG: Fic family protein [bacterium]